MDKLIYLILNKKNDLDDNINFNKLLKNDTINYVLVDINKIDKIYYNKKDKRYIRIEYIPYELQYKLLLSIIRS